MANEKKLGNTEVQRCEYCGNLFYQRVELLGKGKHDESKCPYCKKILETSTKYEFFNYIFD